MADSPMDFVKKLLYAIGALGILLAGYLLVVQFNKSPQILGGVIAAIGIITFAAFYRGEENEDTGTAMRRAIAGSVVVVWLVFFGIVVFGPTETGSTAHAQGQAAQQLSEAADAVGEAISSNPSSPEVAAAATAVSDAARSLAATSDAPSADSAAQQLGESAGELRETTEAGDAEATSDAAAQVSSDAQDLGKRLTQVADTPLTRDLLDDFRWIVIAVIGFYFGTETTMKALEHWNPRG